MQLMVYGNNYKKEERCGHDPEAREAKKQTNNAEYCFGPSFMRCFAFAFRVRPLAQAEDTSYTYKDILHERNV